MARRIVTVCVLLVLLYGCKTQLASQAASSNGASNNGTGSHHAATETHSSYFGYADSVNNGSIAIDTMKGSPKRVAMADIGNSHVHIAYGSPGVKGRVIWGGLVAYNTVWATGAHQATSISFSNPVQLGGVKVPAGTYAFFTIPGKDEWTVILNKNTQQHLADDYDKTQDVLRLTLKPEAHAFTPRLTYSVTATSPVAGIVAMAWENVVVKVPVTEN